MMFNKFLYKVAKFFLNRLTTDQCNGLLKELKEDRRLSFSEVDKVAASVGHTNVFEEEIELEDGTVKRRTYKRAFSEFTEGVQDTGVDLLEVQDKVAGDHPYSKYAKTIKSDVEVVSDNERVKDMWPKKDRYQNFRERDSDA